ncbi:MAG: NAD(P)H-binding protein [Chlorobi bacterium]|nr:NAD(P)H-binding protein [Chlorobiota bacterium]
MKKTALVIGSTGLVGRLLVLNLLEDNCFEKIISFSRRSLDINHSKLREYLIDFEEVNKWKEWVRGDVLFSALGTTIKQAGSKAAQYKVDFTYQYEVARIAAENQVSRYVLVSSLGADPTSRIFYSRMKGELDEAVRKLGFEKISIVRPSALKGEREKERKSERIVIAVTGSVIKILPFLKKYQPIDAGIVARAMINISMDESEEKYRIFNNDVLFKLAGNSIND